MWPLPTFLCPSPAQFSLSVSSLTTTAVTCTVSIGCATAGACTASQYKQSLQLKKAAAPSASPASIFSSGTVLLSPQNVACPSASASATSVTVTASGLAASVLGGNNQICASNNQNNCANSLANAVSAGLVKFEFKLVGAATKAGTTNSQTFTVRTGASLANLGDAFQYADVTEPGTYAVQLVVSANYYSNKTGSNFNYYPVQPYTVPTTLSLTVGECETFLVSHPSLNLRVSASIG